MEGLSIIESRELLNLKQRLENIEQNQLAILKLLQQMNPVNQQSNLPGYISIMDAAKKYKTSRVNINNKIRQFKKEKGREIDRLQSGAFKLINESELQDALRLRTPLTVVFKKAL